MHFLLFLLLSVLKPAVPIDWPEFFSSTKTTGLTFSDKLLRLNGQRVRLRGYSVGTPSVPGGLLVTHMPYDDPHEVEEVDVPYDAVLVLWRKGTAIPPVPHRPTIEGILHLGNHDSGPVIVAVTIDDAVPALAASTPQRANDVKSP